MRFQKSIRNLLISWIGQLAYIIINLYVRKVFVARLGLDVLGISGLFSNIISMLSFAELGIASAICYSLYKPLAEQDTDCIQSVMYLFKLVYRCIGILILMAGIGLIPFLHILVKEINNYENIYVYYGLFVINTAVSYFYVYKATLIEANQDRYIKILIHYVCVCMLGIVQIVSLLFFSNYFLFLVLQISFTLGENICISMAANKMFPYLKEKKNKLPEEKVLKEIKHNVVGTALNKLSILNATDNILISRYVGLEVTGIFSNYTYITSGIGQILVQVYGAVQAGIGNLNVLENLEKVKKTYKELMFCGHFMYSLCFIIILNCISDFICFWFEESTMLNMVVVYLHLLNFYIAGIRTANITFLNAMGLYWRGKYRGILEGTLNLVISIILASRLGLSGIIIGTFISEICVGCVMEPYILCKYGFRTSIFFSISTMLKNGILLFTSSALILIICQKIIFSNILLQMIIKCVISGGLCIVITYAVYGRTYEYKSLIGRIRHIMSSVKQKVGEINKE
ncbi:MAG: hypothetical protein NC313_07320 [Butyrivibrio sp.]|nr:hypothetical protein [Butyrivibrio sp.]